MKNLKEIKESVLNRLGNEVVSKLQQMDYLIIDEAIEGLINGKCKIDDRLPESDDECFFVVCYYFISAKGALKELLNVVLLQKDKFNTITINYRGTEFTY